MYANTDYCYLLGSEACRDYGYGGVNAVIETIVDGKFSGDVVMFNEDCDPDKLVQSIIGWSDVSLISKEDYIKIKKYL